MQAVSVQNMRSSSGREVPNQFTIWTDDGVYFQSYKTVIAFKANDGQITLDRASWDYSTTTGKYRNQFLDMDKKQTERLIKSGEIALANLN